MPDGVTGTAGPGAIGPDGTPNPGHFGANVAAPLLIDVFAALPEYANGMPRTVPQSVSQTQICWPLGVRYRSEAAHECHVRRSAWLLNDTAPPTFPDRLRGGEPRYAFHVSTLDGLRVTPDCAPAEMARIWPGFTLFRCRCSTTIDARRPASSQLVG